MAGHIIGRDVRDTLAESEKRQTQLGQKCPAGDPLAGASSIVPRNRTDFLYLDTISEDCPRNLGHTHD